MYVTRYQIQYANLLRHLRACIDGMDNPEALDMLGVYRFVGTAAVTYYRLVLDGHGNYTQQYWSDLLGVYFKSETGTYTIQGDQWVPKTSNRFMPLQALWIGRHPETGRRTLTPEGRSIVKGGRDIYTQETYPQVLKCISLTDGLKDFKGSMTLGKHYLAIGTKETTGNIVVLNDRGRTRQYPQAIFQSYQADITPMDHLLAKLKTSTCVKLNPSATIAELKEFEEVMGVRLPQDFVRFYLFCNGLEGEEDIFRVIPLAEIMEDQALRNGQAYSFAEYLIYSDTWEIQLNSEHPNQYSILNGIHQATYPTVELTNSLPEFLLRYLDYNGGFTKGGLYTWYEEKRNT